MARKPDPVRNARHARLFELIRQGNVAGGVSQSTGQHDTPDPGDMRRFLKHAKQSLKTGDKDQPVL